MKKLLLFLALFAVATTTVAWLRYGGGEPYANLTSPPLVGQDRLEAVLSYREPLGNVAVAADGRLFFTVHPESRPVGNKLLTYVDGASEPWPNGRAQQEYFDTPLGVAADALGRLWVIDHGNHGMRQPRLLGFDIESGRLIADERFSALIAPAGSFLQDLVVTPDGGTVLISDASFWRQRPALIVYDVESGSSRRVLERHPSVAAENFLIESNDRAMSFLGGMVSLRGGVNGLAANTEWLYYGATTGSGLYRVPLADLKDPGLPASELGAAVERYATKPLSDGMEIDTAGNLYVTDVEHNAVYRVGSDRKPLTLVQSSSIRWPDGLAMDADGFLYITDSALPDLVLRSPDEIRRAGPFTMYRLRLDP